MDFDSKKKKEHELEKRLRIPKSILSKESFIEADTEETTWLIDTFLLGRFYLYEPSNDPHSQLGSDRSELEEMYQREQTLSELKAIIKTWIVTTAKETGMDEILAQEEEAPIFTFGSHRLGVNSRGGDIDTLVLCPGYVDRNRHFFENLFYALESEPHVEELVKVNDPKVLVPVIKMTFHGIPVDLAFAKVDLPIQDKRLKTLNDHELLATMDEKMVYSMNGPRNVDMIIQSVDATEDAAKISNFRTTLKFIKLWAKNKGIYSNAMGYVTGISLAILVAKICQLFPNLKPNKLVQKFFQYYSIWNWDEFPVKIEEIKTYENLEKFNDMQWYDPSSEVGLEKITQKKKNEYTSPMMVITPAFPTMNSTKKVTRTNLEVIKEMLIQGRDIVQSKPINWHKLFEKFDFFHKYFNFIEVSILANDESEFHRWSGLIESQMIVFTKALETSIELAAHPRSLQLHPYPVGFSKPDEKFKYCTSFYYGLKFTKPTGSKGAEEYIDLYEATLEFISRQMGRRQEGKYQTANLRIVQLTRNELHECVFQQMETSGRETGFDTTKNLVKRPLETSQENEFEPEVGKKRQLNKEDLEAKSVNFTNSTTASPHELHDYNATSLSSQASQKAFQGISDFGINKENVEDAGQKTSALSRLSRLKAEALGKTVKKSSVSTRITNFKDVDTSSLLKESRELDEFL